ncbi:alpha/beta hydrolase [Nocardiopsis sp. RSe5-2]|uniref:Alpha/beta hydrolase n=1 Tax=Nocardiopsis endophytica TaxID=3018445 RepID=A0ABT4U937_9ACTN|nr:alpha/beta hydrolase [Nocardiopsis endophytica]MDA2812930.1 alpha/beta hydrolase [Nocardiopsis endophytica]
MFDESLQTVRGRRLAVLDSGGDGPVVLALHGHFSRGAVYAPLAESLKGRFRVVAPDQRAHGRSEGGPPLTPDEYVHDAAELIERLGTGAVAVIGHSMGGIVAYRLAARFPELVRALVVVDIGTVNERPDVEPVLDVSDWPRRAPTREALAQAIEARGVPSWFFMQSAAEFDDGWGLLFDRGDLMESQRALIGDHMAAWKATEQAALLLRGGDSFMLSADEAERMRNARPGVETVEFPGCGHWLYEEEPERFASVIGSFLDRCHRQGAGGSGGTGSSGES